MKTSYENDTGPSHNEDFECLETAVKWLQRQENAIPIHLTYLRRIRDMAALKRKTCICSTKTATRKKYIETILP